MNCRQCPLLRVCEQAIEYTEQQRKIAVEADYVNTRLDYDKQWRELAARQPEDLSKKESTILKAEASVLRVLEQADEISYALAKTNSPDWYDQKRDLQRDIIDCPGPKINWRPVLLGRLTLRCASESRIERAKLAEEKLRNA